MSSNSKHDFKALQKYWYDKIKEIDPEFEDIEADELRLKEWHNHKFQQKPPEVIREIESYFEIARRMLHTFEFKSTTHYKIWELYCEGLDGRKIAKQLGTHHYTWVYRVIRILEEEMK